MRSAALIAPTNPLADFTFSRPDEMPTDYRDPDNSFVIGIPVVPHRDSGIILPLSGRFIPRSDLRQLVVPNYFLSKSPSESAIY